MNYSNLIVAGLNLDIDYKRMAEELEVLMTCSKAVPFSYDNLSPAYSLFLRENTMPDYSYRGAKLADINNWDWDLSLNIPYTKEIVSKLPFRKLGTVRIVYFKNIPCKDHTDWDDRTNLKNTLGLSIIPSTGGTHCNVWSEKLNKYVSIPSNAMLLNDSIRHNVPTSVGTRITMRLFGDLDYSWFDDKIIQQHCYTSD